MRSRWLVWILFPVATVDFWLLGWCLPAKDGMTVDALALSVAVVAACSVGWIILRFARKDKAVLLGWLFVVTAFAMISHPIFASAKAAAEHTKCLLNLKYLGQSLSLYSADNDDRFPPADRWRSVSEGYRAKSISVGNPDPARSCPLSTSPWSYGFNSAFSEVGLKNVDSPDKTVAVFDSDADIPDAAGGPSSLSHRHGEVAGIAFADGHVKFHVLADLRWQPRR